MNKLFTIFTVMAIAVTGCKTVTNPTTVTILAQSIGAATAATIRLANADDNVVVQIQTIASIVGEYTVESNMSYTVALKPVVEAHIKQRVEDGKLSNTQESLVNIAVSTLFKGIDYMFDKHPEWRKSVDLTSSAIGGFINGLNTGLDAARSVSPITIDVKEYEAVKEYFAAMSALQPENTDNK